MYMASRSPKFSNNFSFSHINYCYLTYASCEKNMTHEDFRIQKRLNLNPQYVEERYGLIAEIDGIKNS